MSAVAAPAEVDRYASLRFRELCCLKCHRERRSTAFWIKDRNPTAEELADPELLERKHRAWCQHRAPVDTERWTHRVMPFACDCGRLVLLVETYAGGKYVRVDAEPHPQGTLLVDRWAGWVRKLRDDQLVEVDERGETYRRSDLHVQHRCAA